MSEIGLHFNILLIYFIYGLGFFALGLAMTMEVGRSSSALASSNLLIPLAGFGLMHGFHEWLEIYLLQLVWLGYELPLWISIFRLTLLGISFLVLVYFGFYTMLNIKPIKRKAGIIGTIALIVYLACILFWGFEAILTSANSTLQIADVLIREPGFTFTIQSDPVAEQLGFGKKH
jgi:hypothetical protein